MAGRGHRAERLGRCRGMKTKLIAASLLILLCSVAGVVLINSSTPNDPARLGSTIRYDKIQIEYNVRTSEVKNNNDFTVYNVTLIYQAWPLSSNKTEVTKTVTIETFCASSLEAYGTVKIFISRVSNPLQEMWFAFAYKVVG
jgi:hypothetical protein